MTRAPASTISGVTFISGTLSLPTSCFGLSIDCPRIAARTGSWARSALESLGDEVVQVIPMWRSSHFCVVPRRLSVPRVRLALPARALVPEAASTSAIARRAAREHSLLLQL